MANPVVIIYFVTVGAVTHRTGGHKILRFFGV